MQKNEATTIEFGFKESVVHHFFLNQRKIYSFMGLFALLAMFAIAYLTAGPTAAEATKAKQLFELWKQAPLEKQVYRDMRASVQKIPGLERSLEAPIAQVMLSHGLVDSADPFAVSCLARLQKESPLHAAFAYTSVLIEKNAFQKALESSVTLKEERERAGDHTSSLYACNLLRIAFLQKKVCSGPGELSAWEEVKRVIATQGNSNAALFLKTNFDEKNFSLSDFIALRERLLTK